MDAGLLETLAKVAGIGGIALGVFLLLFRSVIRKNIFPTLSDKNAYRVIRQFLYLTFGIALVGIAAWALVSVSGRAGFTKHVTVETVTDDFSSINGTGWILVGNYDFDKEEWTWGPFFSFERGVHGPNEIPRIGESIRITATRHVVILDWNTAKDLRRLDRPGIDKGVVTEAEDFTPLTLGPGAIVDVADVSAGHFPGRQDVVWVRVIPPPK